MGLPLLPGGVRIGRQEHSRLDVDQRRGHENEFPGHIDVQLLKQMEVVEVLLRDPRNRDIVDVDLLLANQVEQQVQRPLVHGAFDRRRRLASVRQTLSRRGRSPSAATSAGGSPGAGRPVRHSAQSRSPSVRRQRILGFHQTSNDTCRAALVAALGIQVFPPPPWAEGGPHRRSLQSGQAG